MKAMKGGLPGRIAASTLLLAALAGCLHGGKAGSISTLRRSETIPVTVRVESDPPGARVYLAESGQEIGVTPCTVEMFRVSFDDWSLVNPKNGEADRLATPPSDANAAYAVVTTRKGRTEAASEPLTVSLRLERDGYLPEVVTREIPPDAIPDLMSRPEIRLRARLTPAPPR